MVSLLGREAELTRIQAVLASSKQGRAARAVRIVGPTGIGKSALLAAAIEGAQPQWLIGLVTSHHIQSSLPLFAARRAVQALLDRLGSQAERYTSGLDLSREQPEVFEESFYR
ncbi:MAG TPA: AAA family ATPase, partial [Candidatus Baltobacteraceae bacterium]|nr:AAA family ATPase [Candidatus Baltobacteraceae bacterium]